MKNMLIKSQDLMPGKLYMITSWMNPVSKIVDEPPAVGTILLCTQTTIDDSYVLYNKRVFTSSKVVYFLVGLKEKPYIVSRDAVFEEIS